MDPADFCMHVAIWLFKRAAPTPTYKPLEDHFVINTDWAQYSTTDTDSYKWNSYI